MSNAVQMTGRSKRRWLLSFSLIPGAKIAAIFMFAVAGAGAATCPDADPQALVWLEKMSDSLRRVNYHGVVTLQRGDDMQVMQVSHTVVDGSSYERLTELTGQGARVVRTGHPLDCVHPGHKLLRASTDLQAGRCGIAEQYRFSVGDGERVAGRQAVRVRIEPRDMYRFGYVLELDRETGLLLKAETVGRGDERLEKFQFADLSFTDSGQDAADVNLVHEAMHPHPEESQAGNGVGQSWRIGWVPKGFVTTDGARDDAGRKTFTDGLAVFSVFLEELAREIRPGEGVVRNGSTTSYTRGLQLATRPVLVTVIGEVPVNTARMVADSIAWVP